MTAEEAINVINTWIEPMRKTLYGTLTHEFLDAVETLAKKEIKYRWHDLKKNPDDLPEPWEYVLIHTYKDEVYVAQTDPIFRVWILKDSKFDYCEFGSVMVRAWKEIESFEEE